MKPMIDPMIQWIKSPWPFFISLAIASATALTMGLLWMENEAKPPTSQPSTAQPPTQSSDSPVVDNPQETTP
ncbi:MAG: hypothetical protein VKJ64_17715 [Leptolyngbyaceae bacterium]|nr:hypothetical protein [Leptolyngbyaceae bacterium]